MSISSGGLRRPLVSTARTIATASVTVKITPGLPPRSYTTSTLGKLDATAASIYRNTAILLGANSRLLAVAGNNKTKVAKRKISFLSCIS